MTNKQKIFSLVTLTIFPLLSIICQDLNYKSIKNTSKTIQVGPTRDIQTPGAAKSIAEDGDIIEIDAGTYEGDYVIWTQNNLTLKGMGGKAHIKMGNSAISNQKALWVIQGNNTTIENIEFSGATVPDKNGAGIRQEGNGLVVRNCYFHNNEDGILGGGDTESEVLIEYSEFAYNGHGDGYSHNMYIGNIKKFTLQYSYTHHAVVGHNVKTRAEENLILYNQIMDSSDGTASRSIDVPDGGLTFIIGNVIQQGPKTQNSNMVGYASESTKNEIQELYAINNTLVSDRVNGTYFRISNSPKVASLVNNLLVGEKMSIVGATSEQDNLELPETNLIDRKNYNYHLAKGSDAINAGADPGTVHDVSLLPQYQYVHPLLKTERIIVDKIDVGAYEFSTEVNKLDRLTGFSIKISPIPTNNFLIVSYNNPNSFPVQVWLTDINGRVVVQKRCDNKGINQIEIDCTAIPPGMYICSLSSCGNVLQKKIIIN